jgi:hypothetical protein
VAEIILHAGMAKTGSTSVQRWLGQNAERLRTEHGLQMLVATNQTPRNPSLEVHLEPYESGGVNSGLLAYAWSVDGFGPTVPLRFVDELEAFAAQHDRVLVTAEGMSMLFSRLVGPFLAALEALTPAHTVRVAYYVRPQNSALESWWREAGWRQPADPRDAILQQSGALHYLQTLDGVAQRAPHVEFVMRPFRADLLDAGNVVADFARHFVGTDAAGPDIRENTGLPLEFVNRLRQAPPGMFWSGDTERYPRRRLRAAAANLDLPPTDATRRSRHVLRAYCREVFEAGNVQLIERLQWPTREFVPPATFDGAWDLAELDDLWTPDLPPEELARFFDTLQQTLSATEPGAALP